MLYLKAGIDRDLVEDVVLMIEVTVIVPAAAARTPDIQLLSEQVPRTPSPQAPQY